MPLRRTALLLHLGEDAVRLVVDAMRASRQLTVALDLLAAHVTGLSTMFSRRFVAGAGRRCLPLRFSCALPRWSPPSASARRETCARQSRAASAAGRRARRCQRSGAAGSSRVAGPCPVSGSPRGPWRWEPAPAAGNDSGRWSVFQPEACSWSVARACERPRRTGVGEATGGGDDQTSRTMTRARREAESV